MSTQRIVTAVLLLACLAPTVTWADETTRLDALWKEYTGLRKNRSVAETRRRKLIVRDLAEVDGAKATKRLCEIFAKDPCPPPRLAALIAICRRGDLDCVKTVVSQARRSKDYVGLWLGEALSGTEDPEVGRWLAGDARLLKDRKAGVLFVEVLGRLRVQEAVPALLKLHQKLRKSKTKVGLHYEAIAALGRIGGEPAAQVLIDAAAHQDPRRRLAVADTALASEPTDALLGLTYSLMDDKDWRVREAAAVTAGASQNLRFVPDLIPLLDDERLRVRAAARAALVKLAGGDLGTDGSAWSDWWKKREENGAAAPDGSTTVATVKDSRLYSDGVLFILDISKSMAWQKPNTTRLDVAKAHMIPLIRRLKPPTVFNVVALAGRPYPWKKARGRKSGSVPATPENIEEAVAWIESRTTAVHTNIYGALEETAEERPEIDTIYFFSDGAVGVGGYMPPEETLRRFRQLNRFRRLVIHSTFMMWPPRLGWATVYENADEQAEFFSALSRESDGSFVQFRAPPPDCAEGSSRR